MIVLNDDFFLFSLSFIAFFISMGLISTIAFTATGLFSMLMSWKKVENGRELNSADVSGFVSSLSLKTTELVTQILVYVFRTLLTLFPFLVIVVLLNGVHESYPALLVSLEHAYNKFLVSTPVISGIRSGTWFLKITAEVLHPLRNFVISTPASNTQNIMSLVLSDLEANQYAEEFVLSLGSSISMAAAAIYEWIQRNWECRYYKWASAVNVLDPETMSCLDFETRELQLEDSILHLQNALFLLVKTSTQLCPVALGFIETAAFPLTQPALGRIVSALLNMAVQLAWDLWDVTQLRCRDVVDHRQSLFYCVPDVRPVFASVKRAVEDTGALLDDWIQEANDSVLGLFLERTNAATNIHGDEMLSRESLASQFADRPYTLVRLDDYTIAYTDGAKVIWRSPVGTGNRVQEDAFQPAVSLRHGIAPVSFQDTPDESDFDGEARTSLMGCACTDAGGRIHIRCSVAVFSATGAPELAANQSQVIDVGFENAQTAQYLTSSTIQIAVQPVVYPQISADEKNDRLESREFAFASMARDCLADPRQCNHVDAVVWVKPLCVREKSFNYNGNSQQYRNRNRVACTDGARFSSCFPFCMALHYRGSGSYPMTLYDKQSIDSGVWRTNTQCSATTAGEALRIASTRNSQDEYAASTLRTQVAAEGGGEACRPATTYVATSVGVAAANQSALVPPRDMQGFEWAWEQPVAFCGDAILVPSCSIQNGDCVWTVSVVRLTSTVLGVYQMREVMAQIPAESASTGWQRSAATTSSLFRIPYATSDVFADQNLGVQTRTGFVYGTNPDLEVIPQEYLQTCGDEGSVTSIEVTSNFRSSRLFLTRPQFECQRGELLRERNQLFYDELLARSCSSNLTREIVFEGDDRFWSAENIGSDSLHNLFIQSVSLFDQINVLVVVRHGFLRFIKHELGLRTPGDPACPYPANARAETRLYFVHVRTLMVRRDVPWPLQRRPKPDNIVPDLMTLAGAGVLVGVELTELVVNRYMLNLFGIMEKKFDSAVNQGTVSILHHGAYDGPDAPLALNSVTKRVVNQHALFDLTVLKTVRYVSIFVGLDPNVVHWSHSAVVAAVNLATRASLTAYMALAWAWDEVLLRFINERIYASERDIALSIFRGISNLVYDAVETNTLKNMVLGPSVMFCNRLPHLTLDAAGPLGQTLFHACRAAVESQYALWRTASTMVVLSDVSNCICSVEDRDDLNTCLDTLPGSIQTHYRSYWGAKSVESNEERFTMCVDIIQIFRANLLDMPTRFLNHIDLALAALNNVPAEIAGYFGMYEELREICTESPFDSTQQLTQITPQPISAFKRCGYTKVCQQRCQLDILQFDVEKTRVQNPNVAITGQYKRSVPTNVEAIQGLSDQEPFEPIATQRVPVDPRDNTGCDSMIVVIGRTIPDDPTAPANRKWSRHSICVVVTDQGGVYMKLYKTGELEKARKFFMFAEIQQNFPDQLAEYQRTRHQVIDVVISHRLRPGCAFTVYLSAWEKQMFKNGVYRICVDNAGVETAEWIMDSVNVAISAQMYNAYKEKVVFDEAPATGDMSDEAYPYNPVFTHVSLAPAPSGDDAFLFVIQVHFQKEVDFRVLPLVEMKDFVGFFNEGVESLQKWDFPSRATPLTLGWMAYHKMFSRGSFSVVEFASGGWGVAKFERGTRGVEDVMTMTTYDVVYNSSDNQIVLQRHISDAPMNLSRTMGGAAGLFQDVGLYEFTREPTVFASPCRARVLHLGLTEDDWDTHKYSSFSCNDVATTEGAAWLNEMRIEREPAADLLWRVTVEDSLQVVEQVSVEAECNFMSCHKCRDRELQRRCYAAENCATRRCIATVFNHQNVFCVSGGIVKEAVEIINVDFRVGFHAFVEIYIGIFSITQSPLEASTIDVQSLSDYFTARFCEYKDLSVHVASVIPSIFSTVYHLQRVRIQSSPRIASAALDFISPKSQLQVRLLTTYMTEIINAVLLGAVHYLYMSQKVILCGADKLAELSGGVVNILDNTIGSEETNICIFDSFATSDSQVPSDNEIIQQNMLRDFGGGVKTTEIRREGNRIKSVLVKIGASAPTLVMINKHYQKFIIINQINTLVDWILGIFQSVARFMANFDDPGCRPYASNIRYMSQCVCGDEAYAIAGHAAGEGVSDAAFWCSGVLELFDSSGTVKYLYNPYSFQSLKEKLDDPTDSKMIRFLDCLGRGETDCSVPGEDDSFMQLWAQAGVNPLSVLTRCRDNFAGKIFDRGAFMIYNQQMQDVIRQQRGHAVTMANIASMQQSLESVLDTKTKTCLQDGPTFNPIGSCMMLFFESRSRGLESEGMSFFDYFQYTKVPGPATGHGHDACGYLSTVSFGEGTGDFNQDIATCRQKNQFFCDGSETSVPCKVLFTTQTLMSGVSSNVVDTFSTAVSNVNVDEDYETIRGCALATLDLYIAESRSASKIPCLSSNGEVTFCTSLLTASLWARIMRSRFSPPTLTACWRAWCIPETQTRARATLSSPVRRRRYSRRTGIVSNRRPAAQTPASRRFRT